MVAAAVGVVGAFLPGAEHDSLAAVLGLSAVVFSTGSGASPA